MHAEAAFGPVCRDHLKWLLALWLVCRCWVSLQWRPKGSLPFFARHGVFRSGLTGRAAQVVPQLSDCSVRCTHAAAAGGGGGGGGGAAKRERPRHRWLNWVRVNDELVYRN